MSVLKTKGTNIRHTHSKNEEEVIWKDVVGYEGLYRVSNDGVVKNIPRTFKMKDGRNRTIKKETIMSFEIDKDGYYRVGLRKNAKQLNHYVHRLVANAFIHNPNNKEQVNHIDGIKNNNNVENLEWVTHKENREHAAANGLVPDQWGRKNPNSKLTEQDVLLIKKLKEDGMTYREVSENIGTSISNVKNIVLGRTWKWLFDKEADQR